MWYTGPIDIIAPEVSPVGTRSRLYKRTKMAAGGGYLPDSQKSLHRYTDDGVVPREGMQGVASNDTARAGAPTPEER